MAVANLDTTKNVSANVQSKSGNNEMDEIFNELGGTYGRFQIFNYILLVIPHIITGYIVFAYVFTALSLDYR